MTNSIREAATTRSRTDGVAQLAAFLGVGSSVAGVITGIVIAAHAVMIECPNGTYDTPNPTCYSHPHTSAGISVIVLSCAVLSIVTLLILVLRAVNRQPGD